MSIVFGGAPVVNAVVAVALHPPADGLSGVRWPFILGILMAATGGYLVTRYRPDGSIERVLKFPAPLTTSCCFGGAGLETLYVTTASFNLDDAARRAAPLSGGLFAVTGLGVRGRPCTRFRG